MTLEVLLATCVVVAAVAALAGAPRTADPSTGLHRAGGVALGVAAGLAGCLCLTGGSPAYEGWLLAAVAWPVLPVPGRRLGVALALAGTVFAGTVPAADGSGVDGEPPIVLITLVLLGFVALLGAGGPRAYPPIAALATGAASAVIGCYDNGWRFVGWHDRPHTATLVATLAIVPFALAVGTGLRAPRRPAAVVAALAGAGWIGALALPHLLAWGPTLLLLPLIGAAMAVPHQLQTRRRPDPRPGQRDLGWKRTP